jgi:Flp pilus assembly CpaF family ATPase
MTAVGPRLSVVLPGEGAVDHEMVARLHRAVGEELARRAGEAEAGGGRRLSPEDERALSRMLIAEQLRVLAREAVAGGSAPLAEHVEAHLAGAVFDRLHGLAGIQPLIDDPDVRDIHISGADGVWLSYRDGTKRRGPTVAASDEELIELVATAARRVGRSERRWDAAHPELNLQLPNGDRLHALMAVTGRPTVTIRRHDFSLHRLEQLWEFGVVDDHLLAFLTAAVRAKLNLIVAGGTGTGKTTLLRCLINEIPDDERIITIEDSLEIGLEHFAALHPDFETIEAREANTEGVGEFSLADGVRAALRMDPDRVIVGEVRGAEVLPMLLAMSQGNDGSMCSIHADSSKGVFGRLAMYAAMTRERLDPDVTNLLVANAVDVIVHLGWIDGRRRVTSVREVTGAVETGQVASNELWAPAGDGRARGGGAASARLASALEPHGFDRSMLLATGRWAQ